MSLAPRIDRHEQNMFINGDHDVWQRGTSFVAPSSGDFTADRVSIGGAGASVIDVDQDTNVPTLAQSGHQSNYSLKVSVTTVDAAPISGDRRFVQRKIEGFNWKKLAGRKCMISFWVYATKTGTNCVAFRNTDNSQSYVVEYTVNTTNDWQRIDIPLDFTTVPGNQNFTNGIGLIVTWSLMPDIALQTGTIGSWQSGNFLTTSNQVNHMDSLSNIFHLSQMMIHVGQKVSSFSTAGRNITEEITMCEQYYEKSYDLTTNPGTVTNLGSKRTGMQTTLLGQAESHPFRTRKRAVPTITVHNTNNGTGGQCSEYNTASSFVADRSISLTEVGETSFSLVTDGTTSAGNNIRYQYTADAEL